MKNKEIEVYVSIDSDVKVGTLFCEILRGKEVYSFAFDESYLNIKKKLLIDPELELQTGRQYKVDTNQIYGFVSDAIPDRWGRNLILRNERHKAAIENRVVERLGDSDFLLGVNDFTRQGAFRFKLKGQNDFQGPGGKDSVPSFLYLNKLEQSCFDIDILKDEELKDLFNSCSSLGGARPKACLYDNNKNLYIAKFAHKHDDYDVPKLERFVNILASNCKLNVPENRLIKGNKSIFLEKRFDRDKEKRIPYVSAMTLLQASDGSSRNYSYLDLVDLIKTYSIEPNNDLVEMYKRMVFNCIIHNGDDHLRNHGFIYKNKGYVLSPLFDINPDPYSQGLSLSIDGENNDFDLNTCICVSKNFNIDEENAKEIIDEMKNIVKQKFDSVANELNLSGAEMKLFSFIKNICN